MSLPRPVAQLIQKYSGLNVPEMEEPHHDQSDDEAYVVAVMRDLDELQDYVGRPIYAGLRSMLDQHIDVKSWCIKRRTVVSELLNGYQEVTAALEVKMLTEVFELDIGSDR